MLALRYTFMAAVLLLASHCLAMAEDVSAIVPAGPLHERLLTLHGDPDRPVDLEVTVFTPPGSGPFPLAVMNHGADKVSRTNRGPRYRYTFSAYYFLSRGYAVAMPMARGFAGSGGDLVIDGCALDAIGMANARDLLAVIDQLAARPEFDRNRIVVAGQSFGGWTSLALARLGAPGVRGVVAFAPALRASDCRTQDDAMINGAGRFGQQARLPTLWFFGDNDSVVPTATWHRMFEVYQEAGGHAELVAMGKVFTDSHQMLSFPETLPRWTPVVDRFLARNGLPSAEIHPEYLPLIPPPPTHAAEVGDVAAVPFLNDKGRDSYRNFLKMPFKRVFAMSADGAVSVANGGFDPLARALAACHAIGRDCRPYAIDDDVVWPASATGTPLANTPASPPALQVFTLALRRDTTSPLNFAYAVKPDCSSRGLPKIVVTRPPAHGAAKVEEVMSNPHFPPTNPLASCNTTPVPGVTVGYTPQPGFTGADTLDLLETDVDGHQHAYRLVLTIS